MHISFMYLYAFNYIRHYRIYTDNTGLVECRMQVKKNTIVSTNIYRISNRTVIKFTIKILQYDLKPPFNKYI